jgi:hypothetical protein
MVNGVLPHKQDAPYDLVVDEPQLSAHQVLPQQNISHNISHVCR